MKLRFINHVIIYVLLLMSHVIFPATMVTVNSTGNQSALNPAVSAVTSLGTITLRSAFEFSQNGASAPTTIIFDIPTSDPGFQPSTNTWRITPTTAMSSGATFRATTKQVIVDGYQGNTAHPASSNTNPMTAGSNAVIRIEIRGPGISNTIGSCIRVDGVNGCEFRGLCINRFLGFPAVAAGMAIRWTNAQNTIVAGNFLGTDVTGMFDSDPATGDFLGFLRVSQIVSGHGSTYGGSNPADTNVVNGAITENIIAFTTDNFTVRRNYIGTNKLGNATFAHFGIGVEYEGGSGITIDNNVLSGNNDAMQLLAPDNFVVTNNKIGTNADGTAVLGNIGSGMLLGSEAPVTNVSIINNVISGNRVGLRLGFNYPGENLGISGVTVQGNKIGTDVTGTLALGNVRSGILVQRVNNSLIGSFTQTLSEQNIISGNGEDGVRITEGSSGNGVLLNKIGTEITGTKIKDVKGNTLGNTLNGVRIGIGQGAASDNSIGL